MPRVPTYDNLQVRNDPLPGPRETSSATAVTFGGYNAELEKQAGQGLMSLADEIGKQQDFANRLRVDDAVNKSKEAALKLTFDKDNGYLNIKGQNALERQSGKPLSDEYSEKLQETISGVSQSLGNERQRQLFAMHSNDITTSFRGQVMKHEGEEFKSYALSVREGTVKRATDEVGLFYNDPARIDSSVQSIQAAVYDSAKLLGKSAEWADAEAKRLTSNAHKVALEAALQKNDVTYADQYLKKYAGQMNSDDMLRANGLITKELDVKIANATVRNVMTGMAPKLATSDGDRLANLVMGAESGGKDFAPDGTILTSPKGAKGRMQVLDGTNKDPGFGVKPAQNDSVEERARVGRDYLQAMLREFKGNVPQALAAYNAGPGAVKEAVAAAKDDPSGWIKNVPGETQKYVTGIMKSYGTGDGTYQKPTLQEVHAQIRQQIGDGDGNAHRLKLALEESTRQFSEAEKAIKQRDDEAVANAMRALQQNGGRYSDLPPNVRAAIPAKDVDNVMNFGQKVAKGDDITDPAVYLKLSDQKYLTSLSDNEFYRVRVSLSESDFRHFSTQRATAQGKGTNKVEELNNEAFNRVLKNRLQTLGIDPTPKDGSSDAQRVGAMQKFITDSVLAQQKVNGKQMTDTDVEKHIDGLFAKSAEFRTTFLGFSTGTSRERLMTMKVGDIPGATRTQLEKDFKARGIDKPTDADFLGAYFHLKTALAKPRSGAIGNW